MRVMRRSVVGGAVMALVAGLCVAVTSVAVTSGAVTGTAHAATPPVLARHGNLTETASGLPATSNQAQQLRSAAVRQDLAKSTVSGTFVLRASPPASEPSHGAHGRLSVNFGTYDSGNCVADGSYGRFEVPLAGDLAGSGFSRSGATYTLSRSVAAAGWAPWNCAYALVLDGSDNHMDLLGGSLSETHGKPALRVKSVRQLGSTKKPVKLVRGVWTPLEVEIVNPGAADAAGVVINGNGKGLQVKRKRVGTVSTVGSTTTTVRVRLKGKRKKSVLRLRVTGGGAKAARQVKVKRFTPKKPVAGRYVNKKKGISFRVRNGRVVQFRGRIQSQCGVWPQFRYNTQQWRFPKAKIRKDGIVQKTVRNKNRRLDVRMRIVGRKANLGRFDHSSPDGYCHGSTYFVARRVGR